MRAHRRPLVTAAVAGGLLCGLWFVPSANATGDGAPARPGTVQTQPQEQVQGQPQEQGQARSQAQGPSGSDSAQGAELADTGSFNTTPYLFGGLGFLSVGGVLLAHAHIRSGRAGLTPAAR
ncbi:hypothetical protein V1L54_07845 [Streptomyces sp. TRM 70361]|uniref:hypothetical protein n=1 Tax=Streptomyces sp. TRM 70361 TaxID=3116553 RepID=UPI002E7B7A7B|nr:hypothetical protein [Streptomyces sp. TRM 70361]MEE1939325.1 hypothetical protein [Streptomyces sp. TRM 70361]